MGRVVNTQWAGAFLAVGAATFAVSAPVELARTDLQRHDLSTPGGQVR